MGWWGKLLVGTFGYVLGGPLGAILGAALGHQLDKRLDTMVDRWSVEEREQIQLAFFTATFSVMGRVAKADGRVSEDEISFARAVMEQMSLDEEQRRLAIRLFTEGKTPDFPLDAALDQFRRECHRRQTLMQIFLEIQLQAAFADGRLDDVERDLLLHIFERLGFGRHAFEQIEALVRAARFGTGSDARPPNERLKEAYEVLGLTEEATDAEVKRAYRRLMNQHHPDKLVAKGLPEEMIKLANGKVHEIRQAYETIKQARGLR